MEHAYRYNFESLLHIQRVAPKTKEAYLRAVRDITTFHKKPARELSNTQIQDYLLYIIQEKQLSWSSCNVVFCGLKKFYRQYLERDETGFTIPPRTRSKKIPMLLGQAEVARLLQSPANLKHRALLTIVYSSGLRVSEAVNLKPVHIESDRI